MFTASHNINDDRFDRVSGWRRRELFPRKLSRDFQCDIRHPYRAWNIVPKIIAVR